MYRIIATDLDETMLNDDHQVSQKDIETINRLTEMGVKFVLATGRGYNSTFDLQKRIGLYGRKNEYVISFNGGMITDNYRNELIHHQHRIMPAGQYSPTQFLSKDSEDLHIHRIICLQVLLY